MVDFIGYGILWLGAEDITAEDLWETPSKMVGAMSPSLVTGLSEEWPDGRGTPEYDAMPPILQQVKTDDGYIPLPPLTPGYRFVSPGETQHPNALTWDNTAHKWLPRPKGYLNSPYGKGLIYSVPIEMTPPCGEGYRLVGTPEKPHPKAEVWDIILNNWVPRPRPDDPYRTQSFYRVPIDPPKEA